MNSALAQSQFEDADISEVPLGRLIRERGMRKGYVAGRLGMHPSRLSRVLSSGYELTHSEAVRAAELFGVEVRELLPGGGE